MVAEDTRYRERFWQIHRPKRPIALPPGTKATTDVGYVVMNSVGDVYAGLSVTDGTKWGAYDSYDKGTRLSYWAFRECDFYTNYRKMWLENPFVFMVVEYLLNEVFGDGFHFEGDEASITAANEFFREDDTERKLRIAFRQAILLGNGYINLETKKVNKSLVSTSVIDGESVRLELDELGRKIFEQDYWYVYDTKLYDKAKSLGTRTKLKAENIIHFTIKEYPNTPYGMSLVRPNIDFFRALNDICSDVGPAVKRIAYAPMVYKLNLAGYDTVEKKKAALKEAAKKMHKGVSATSNYTIDIQNEMELLGRGGGAGARLLPINDLIEPIIGTVLTNFGYPLGYYLQTGANRSILNEQRRGVRKFIGELRRNLARTLELQLLSKVAPGEIRVVFDEDIDDWIRRGLYLIRLYERRAVSKEYLLDALNIQDEGTDFLDPETAPQTLPIRDEEFQSTESDPDAVPGRT